MLTSKASSVAGQPGARCFVSVSPAVKMFLLSCAQGLEINLLMAVH